MPKEIRTTSKLSAIDATAAENPQPIQPTIMVTRSPNLSTIIPAMGPANIYNRF